LTTVVQGRILFHAAKLCNPLFFYIAVPATIIWFNPAMRKAIGRKLAKSLQTRPDNAEGSA
jgi:hypothetical protein